ncbi:MAG TPA: hypothetical protein VGF95_11720 [Solirubrobacteraceae bacterium]|jgi:hypothetical protein
MGLLLDKSIMISPEVPHVEREGSELEELVAGWLHRLEWAEWWITSIVSVGGAVFIVLQSAPSHAGEAFFSTVSGVLAALAIAAVLQANILPPRRPPPSDFGRAALLWFLSIAAAGTLPYVAIAVGESYALISTAKGGGDPRLPLVAAIYLLIAIAITTLSPSRLVLRAIRQRVHRTAQR